MTILDHYDCRSYSEAELLEHYADQHLPYPVETEVHVRTSERPSVREARPAPQHASNMRADMVVQLTTDCEVGIEAKTIPFKSPWIESNRSLHEGIGQACKYNHHFDMAELWHFIVVPKPRDTVKNNYEFYSERLCEEMYEYVRSWFPSEMGIGYRLIGVYPNPDGGINRLFTFGSTTVEVGYEPTAKGEHLNYPFSTNYEENYET